MNKTFKNTFETLGDPAPAVMESARAYARGYLPIFNIDPDMGPGRQYRIDANPLEQKTGFTREIEWWREVFAACTDVVTYGYDDTAKSGFISEERLLDFLEQAVEEVDSCGWNDPTWRDGV